MEEDDDDELFGKITICINKTVRPGGGKYGGLNIQGGRYGKSSTLNSAQFSQFLNFTVFSYSCFNTIF